MKIPERVTRTSVKLASGEMERRVPERRRNVRNREWYAFSAGFTDRRRTLRGMMRDRIPHEHAEQTKEWREPNGN